MITVNKKIKKKCKIESTQKEKNDCGRTHRNDDFSVIHRITIKKLDKQILKKEYVENFCRKYKLTPVGGFEKYSHYTYNNIILNLPTDPQGNRALNENFIDYHDEKCKVYFQGTGTHNEYELCKK